MKLARIFSDGMILQREMPILIWGEVEEDRVISVFLDEKKIGDYALRAGSFQIELPALPAMEDVTLRIGDIILSRVDIGDVWVANGQSNMELEYLYTSDRDEKPAADPHLRMYTVGQYSFAGERELGDKAWKPWDRWYAAVDQNEDMFSAVGYHFAKNLRGNGVPVGVINISWGGTSASAWMDRCWLEEDPELKVYVEEFEALKAALNMDLFRMIKKNMRNMDTNPIASGQMKKMLVGQTVHPMEMQKMNESNPMPAFPPNLASAPIDPAKVMAWGPDDPNEPGALYRYMVSEILGYSVKGVIYYQGESDDIHAEIYDKLLARLIRGWRMEWSERNPSQKELPYYLVQLAPFGCWMASNGDRYPELRMKQQMVSKELEQVYLASISDSGNVFDIHPKEKKVVGDRLACLARKYTYGEKIQADAPVAMDVSLDSKKGMVCIRFEHAEGLVIKPQDVTAYNGFATETIMPEYVPTVLAGVNGLEVYTDHGSVRQAEIRIVEQTLEIYSDELTGVAWTEVRLAQTPFYRVNLYNESDIPAMPFVLKMT